MDRDYTTNGLNQYESAGDATFTYDDNGNLISDGTKTYEYDLENRLVKVIDGTFETQLYYDPLGRLYRILDDDTGETNFVYDGNELVAEYDGSGQLLRRYVHGASPTADDALIWYEGDEMISSTRRYLHADPRGSIVAVTNGSGSSTATNTYDEFGIPGADNEGRFQYTGQVWIPEIGMYYYKARMYSPTLGRFMQTDPIGYGDGLNIYNYVGGDPVNAVDPTGLVRRMVVNGIVYVYNCVGVGDGEPDCGWTAVGHFVSKKDLSEADGIAGLIGELREIGDIVNGFRVTACSLGEGFEIAGDLAQEAGIVGTIGGGLVGGVVGSGAAGVGALPGAAAGAAPGAKLTILGSLSSGGGELLKMWLLLTRSMILQTPDLSSAKVNLEGEFSDLSFV